MEACTWVLGLACWESAESAFHLHLVRIFVPQNPIFRTCLKQLILANDAFGECEMGLFDFEMFHQQVLVLAFIQVGGVEEECELLALRALCMAMGQGRKTWEIGAPPRKFPSMLAEAAGHLPSCCLVGVSWAKMLGGRHVCILGIMNCVAGKSANKRVVLKFPFEFMWATNRNLFLTKF